MKTMIKRLIAAGLGAAMVLPGAGCARTAGLTADPNPDTPVEDVAFPLEETKELSFITSAPATTTQDPNEKVMVQVWRSRPVHILDMLCRRPVRG